jgi:hypothetical protein
MPVSLRNTDILMNSGSAIQDPPGSAPSYLCRAWVNFNGNGTSAIRASGNVSSVTRNGTGSYSVNFSTAMPDANYAVGGMARRVDTNSDLGITLPAGGGYTASGVHVIAKVYSSANALVDADIVTVMVFR